MRRTALLFTGLVLALALASCGGDDEVASTPSEAPGTSTSGAAEAASEPVLAGWVGPVGSEVFLADPLTLEPVDGRSVAVPFLFSAASVSPEGTRLALGGSEQSALQLVDLQGMRATAAVETGLGEWVERLHWASEDLLLASLSGRQSHAAAIDPASGEVLRTAALDGVVLDSAPAGEAIAFLLADPDTIGPARVAVWDGSDLRSATLADVPAGYRSEGDSDVYRTRQAVPGFAVDPDGGRALVVPAGSRVAEVDLETMEAAYHDLSEPVSLLGRLRDWLEPAAEAKLVDGPARVAVWLPNGLVAVSGADWTTEGDQVKTDPAGLALIDPGDWSITRIDDEPSWVAYRDGALLGSAWAEGSDLQSIYVYGEDGSRRFSLEREGADLSRTAGGLLYASSPDGTLYEIVDLGTGEVLAEARPERETFLLYLE